MSTLAGPSKISHLSPEGRFANDGMDNVRSLSFGHESSGRHSSDNHGPLDITEPVRRGVSYQPSGDGADSPACKKQKLDHVKIESLAGPSSDLEKILAKLSPKAIPGMHSGTDHSSSSSHVVAMNEMIQTKGPVEPAMESNPQDDKITELFRLKQELLAANSKIALQEQELAQTRVMKHTLDQALGPPSEADFSGREISEQTITHLQSAFNASNSAFSQVQDAWNTEDSQSDVSDGLSAGAYNLIHRLKMPAANYPKVFLRQAKTWVGSGAPQLIQHFLRMELFSPNGSSRAPSASAYSFYSRPLNEPSRYGQASNPAPHRLITQGNRGSPFFAAPNATWNAFAPSSPGEQVPKSPASPITRSSSAFQAVGLYPMPPYPTRPVATALSPTATEFTASTNDSMWNPSSTAGSSIQTYVSPLEPLNYRRLLDKNVSCDWKYIVDKIICSNDQQASIFLQQKLKVGTSEQKYDIIEAIVGQAYPLMVNRFGNFLVQRCFEHGTAEQVVSIANAIRGNTLSLSMDPFGCHVIQKAFDCVPEEHKAVMVHEILRRIPETVVHRYACHVWQKLFELRWTGEPPQIMTKVNEALHGMWHEVALGETGSLVVQNIFENCVEEEKRPSIEEVLKKIDVLAHGQFGNWCIQHICEHGAPHDKSRAVEHVLHHSVDYSMDQFASKIVEKCLKIGGSEFLERYLSRVCTGRADRPRMPLIDIAGDQYGNYLIQWILMNAASHQRELVASHIRKHMVSLRGSKFGSRVAMLCCNPSHATRPGPGTGMHLGRFNQLNEDRFGPANQTGGRFNRGGQWGSNYTPFR
ncbi:Armadillo-like helical [Penicillium capsulatum]|uniref:Armadillo-like helical n=1 Tax=Penicillium capsulatum TaxID=69766 RepID=A0A9W9ISM9_9EURO|nr:Armadillo-like helical [Penicillium capsulatum]